MAWKGVITNAGAAILAQWSQGGHELSIDSATVGSGLIPEANMRIATALANEVAEASIIQSVAVDGGTRFKVQIHASEGSAYTATELGIWGHLDSGSTVLIAYHEDSAGGVAIPTAAQSPDFAFAIFCMHAIDNTEELTVNIDPAAMVSHSEYEAMVGLILGDFATHELTATASQAYAVGDYLVYDGVLYRVIAEIDEGDTLEVGTNIEQTTVAVEFERHRILPITFTAFSSLPQTVTDSRITADHVVVNSVLGTPSAQTGDWTVTTADGSVSVSGSISSSTTLTLYLALQQ